MAPEKKQIIGRSHQSRGSQWWDTSLDPIGVSLVAAQLDPEACVQKSGKVKRSDARKAVRHTLIRAIQLIQEAQDIIKNGPNPEDVPSEYWEQHSNEEFDKFKHDCEETFNLSTLGERLKARAKLITGEPRANRAEEYLVGFLKHYCEGTNKAEGGFEFKVISIAHEVLSEPSTVNEYTTALEAKDPPYGLLLVLKLRFRQWKYALRRSQASAAAKKGRSKPENKKS